MKRLLSTRVLVVVLISVLSPGAVLATPLLSGANQDSESICT